MICPLCGLSLRLNDDVVLPGPLWSPCHAVCFATADDEDEAADRTITHHAQNQGDAMESLQ